jgi:disulfide bond formation protein DsbB
MCSTVRVQSSDTGILFLSLLAILCQVFVIGTVFWALAALMAPALRSSLRSFFDGLGPLAAPFAFAIALVTMVGSLYMSEVKHFTPCHLCWIQRGLLYPQVIWTLVLWIKPRLHVVRWIAFVMLVADVPISIYHYLLEWYPDLETSVCSLKNPCSLVWFRQFHYLSLPLMALTSACTVLTLLIAGRRAAVNPE